jgi:hypothetical protein
VHTLQQVHPWTVVVMVNGLCWSDFGVSDKEGAKRSPVETEDASSLCQHNIF